MTEKQFIEKAIEGGYPTGQVENAYSEIMGAGILIERLLLDPFFWKAVGKVEAWKSDIDDRLFVEWHSKMHGMIDALIEGKTIEDYLKTL